DLFEVQEQIAKSIGDALSVSLDVGANATAYGGTDNPEAYAAFVQGQVHGLDFDQSVPVRYYEQAIALDPNFVRAYANLAGTYGNRIPAASSKEEMDRLLEEMDAASARALDANPNVALSNTARAWYFVTIKDLPQAETLMQRASELDRGIDFSLRGALAQYAVTMGRNRKALSISESTALIDPIFEDTPAKIFMLMMNGRYRESTTLFDKLTTDPQVSLQPFIFHSFWARVLAGNEAAAIDWLKAMNIPNLTLVAEEFRGFEERTDLHGMDLPALRRWASETYGYSGQFALANLSLVAAYRGHQRLAVDLLRIAFERPGGYALFYLWHPAMAEARKTDAFAQLVVDLGFPEAWEAGDDWGDFCRPRQGGGITCS
ncbi:MAG TPA: hypothetical protein VLA37_12725, partial [Sphingomonadaceae bacterium]|nr:hypothetical protein [Sphingomonadaceae bacterium]